MTKHLGTDPFAAHTLNSVSNFSYIADLKKKKKDLSCKYGFPTLVIFKIHFVSDSTEICD